MKSKQPRNRVDLLNGDGTENVDMYDAHIGLSGRLYRIWTHRLPPSPSTPVFKQSKRRIKLAALMLPLQTEAAAEETTNTWICEENFDLHSKTRHNHNHTDGEQETGNLE